MQQSSRGQSEDSLQTIGAAAFYLDGVKSNVIAGDDGSWTVQLPPGHHRWQITSRQPMPMSPVIIRTENHAGGARVVLSAAAGAMSYLIELSNDNGMTWKTLGKTTETNFDVSNQPDGKVHVRVTGGNDDGQGEPSDEYPLYVSSFVPLPPDGLRLTLEPPSVSLTWGQVLGVSEYRLHALSRGHRDRQLIYHGLDRRFVDAPPGVFAPVAVPGIVANQFAAPQPVYEYTVAAVNDNGEGTQCHPIDTDPASWLNWDPKPGESFRRRFDYNITPFAGASPLPEHYPE